MHTTIFANLSVLIFFELDSDSLLFYSLYQMRVFTLRLIHAVLREPFFLWFQVRRARMCLSCCVSVSYIYVYGTPHSSGALREFSFPLSIEEFRSVCRRMLLHISSFVWLVLRLFESYLICSLLFLFLLVYPSLRDLEMVTWTQHSLFSLHLEYIPFRVTSNHITITYTSSILLAVSLPFFAYQYYSYECEYVNNKSLRNESFLLRDNGPRASPQL